ncbi:putative diguanylate cyclase (plasmid) [Rhizobium tropici CIAT 899]|nr:putative diguanylate cyclase [Rhizobium tropici CIAT 899]
MTTEHQMRLAGLKTTFNSSLTLKIFCTCFLSTHLPLISLAVYLTMSSHGNLGPIFIVVLSATLVGTIFCLGSVWIFLHPLRQVTRAIEIYRVKGHVEKISSLRQDEIGVVTNGVANLIRELDRKIEQLRRQAYTDPLTGLGNRHWFNEAAAREISRAARDKTPLALILLDLDHFKRINDEYGHDVGDKVLMAAGATIQDCLRPHDVAARIGGEEFSIVLANTNLDTAVEIANRLKTRLERIIINPLPNGRVTASFGVYQADPAKQSLKTMLKAADHQLYSAKRSGRNTVCSAAALS